MSLNCNRFEDTRSIPGVNEVRRRTAVRRFASPALLPNIGLHSPAACLVRRSRRNVSAHREAGSFSGLRRCWKSGGIHFTDGRGLDFCFVNAQTSLFTVFPDGGLSPAQRSVNMLLLLFSVQRKVQIGRCQKSVSSNARFGSGAPSKWSSPVAASRTNCGVCSNAGQV